jgi:hypothetical protein
MVTIDKISETIDSLIEHSICYYNKEPDYIIISKNLYFKLDFEMKGKFILSNFFDYKTNHISIYKGLEIIVVNSDILEIGYKDCTVKLLID